MARNSQLTVRNVTNEGAIEAAQPTKITRRKQGEEQKLEAQAVALEELNSSYDPDLLVAMLIGLRNNNQLIKSEYDRSKQLAKAQEVAILEAKQRGAEDGVQEARQQFRAKKQQQLLQQQQKFINETIPEIMTGEQYQNLPDEVLKRFLEGLAAQQDVELVWGTDSGSLTCEGRIKPR